MSLQGMIEEMGLGEVIQALSLNRHVGTLRIEADEGLSKFFYLSEGEIVLIRTVSSEPVRIGELLVRAGKISRDQLNEVILGQKEGGGRLGDRVSRLYGIKGSEIDDVVRKKFEEEFLDIFLLDRGRFEFIFGLSPESLFSPEEKLERVSLNAGSLMLEAMRRVDDWQAKIKEIGSLEEIFLNRMKSMGSNIEQWKLEGVDIPPVARKEIYEAIDGRRTVREILAWAQQQGTSRLGAFHFVVALKAQDLVRPMKAEECLQYAKEAIEKKDPPGAAKYIRAVMSKGPVELKVVTKYLEFLRKSARPQFAQREAKSLAQQYQVRGDLDAAVALYKTALELDPTDTEVLDRLFYALLRKNLVKDAVQVGVRFRDHLSRDNDLPMIARIVKNLKELDGENPAVLELSGLLHKRQERLEEAWEDLKAAFAGWPSGPEHAERRAEMLGHMIELHPERKDLVAARREIVEGASLARERAVRRRAAITTASVGVGLVLIFLAWGEVSARNEIAAAEKKLASSTDPVVQQEALALLDRAASSSTTVARRADRRAAEVRKSLFEEMSKSREKIDEKIRVEQKRKEEEAKASAAREKKAKIDDGLARLASARDGNRLEDAAREVLALWDAFKDDDPRVAALTVPARVTTTPAGARVWLNGKDSGQKTPCLVEVTPRARTRLRVSLGGYAPGEDLLEGGAFIERSLTLQRGPAWQRQLDTPIVGAPVALGDLVVVVDRKGVVTEIDPQDGSVRATVDLKETSGIGLPPAPPAVIGGALLVAGSDGKLVALDAALKPKLTASLGAGTSFAACEVSPTRAAFVAQDKLVVIDLENGSVLKTAALPAPGATPAGSDGDRAFVGLVDGRVACVEVTPKSGAWVGDAKVDVAGAPLGVPALGVVVVPGRNGAVVALSSKDGSIAYSLPPDAGSFESPFVVDGSRAIAATTGQNVVAVDLVQGQRAWCARIAGTAAAPLAIAQGSAFVPTKEGELVEIGLNDGKVRRSFTLNVTPTARPVIAGGRIAVVAHSKVVGIERPGAE